MMFKGLTLVASAFVLAACGGATEDPSAVKTTPAAADTATPAGAVASPPATGRTHEIKMIGDDKGYRFEPANLTVKAGDAIKFVFVSMAPHNVAFEGDKIPAAARALLDANFGSARMGELMSKMYMAPGEGFTLSMANIPVGQYPYHCTPHFAMNMKGVITVQ